MGITTSRGRWRTVVTVALTGALLGAVAANTSASSATEGRATEGRATAAYNPADPVQKAQYDEALSLGTQAYVYGVPLVNMKRVYRTQTSVDVCDAASNGGINRFCPQRQLIDPANHTVVAPNYDTLYAIAWLAWPSSPSSSTCPKAATASAWSRCCLPTRRSSATSATAPRASALPATTPSPARSTTA